MYIGDLHIHSHYSRATSRELTPEHLDLWARKKGIHILGTGDFTHPAWRKELEQKLEPAEPGLYLLKEEYRLKEGAPTSSPSPRFVISGEISSIYKKNGRVRKVHSLILLPSLEAADILSLRLEAIGNLHSDGRPILGLDCHDLLALTLDTCPEAIYVPAHIWTPHFSLFGAFSGFDSIEECYEELTPQIHALETGLSSDPAMNWRLSALDRFQLISNSDAHSPGKLGREASLFHIPLSYQGLYQAIQEGQGLEGTLEFFPEEGKYHFDGHRKCHLCLSPKEAMDYQGVCPVCGKKLTTGVLHRITQLADRQEGFSLPEARPFENLVPLPEIIGAALGVSSSSVKAARQYERALQELGNEFFILRHASLDDISCVCGRLTAKGVRLLREGKVKWRPGYDGEYGTMRLFKPAQLSQVEGQLSLEIDTEEAAPFDASSPAASAPPSEKPETQELSQPDEDASCLPPVSATLFESLNASQQQAAKQVSPVTAVIAGPGTGKTMTMVARLWHLMEVRGVKPSHITVVTFTNQAAAELKTRIKSHLPGKRSLGKMQVGTFHSLCYDLLKSQDIPVILAEEAQMEALCAQVIEEYALSCTKKQFLSWVSLNKSGITKDSALQPSVFPEQSDLPVKQAMDCYCQRLSEMGLMDFDDLLLRTLDLIQVEAGKGFQPQRFSYLLVDEFQDISPVQYDLIKAWNKGGKELFLIGDPDQSIYGFRGSDSRCFEKLVSDYPKTAILHLSHNYRSTPQILHAAHTLISRNSGDHDSLTPILPEGEPIRIIEAGSSLKEGIFIAREINRLVGGMDMLDAHSQSFASEAARSFSDIAVLYRTNHQARLLEQCLSKEDIPYTVTGREDYLAAPSVQRVLCFFKACMALLEGLEYQSPLPAQEKPLFEGLAPHYLERIQKEQPWKLLEQFASEAGLASDESVRQLICMSCFHKTIKDMMRNLELGREGDLKRKASLRSPSDSVALMTFHASKGLEFPVVFLFGLKQGILPFCFGKGHTDQEEERRLLYVAMTRAREELVLSWSEQASPFLSELPSSCIRETKKEPAKPMRQLSLFDFSAL